MFAQRGDTNNNMSSIHGSVSANARNRPAVWITLEDAPERFGADRVHASIANQERACFTAALTASVWPCVN